MQRAPTARQVVYTPIDMDDAEYTDINREPTEEEIDFEKFREELKDGNEYGKINVYRQPTTRDGRPGQKKLTYLFECGIDEYDFSQLAALLRDSYGTGIYRLQGRMADGKLKFNKSISIEAPIKENPNAGGTDVSMIINQLSSALDQQSERMEMIMRPPNQRDIVDTLVKLSPILAPLIASIGAALFKPPVSLADQAKELMMLKKFMGDLNGDDDGDRGVYGLLTETVKGFAPLFMTAIAQGKQSGALDADGIVKPQQLAAPVAPQTKDEKPVSTNPALDQHKQSLQFLLMQAKADADVRDVVNFVLDAVPDDQLDTLEAFLIQENCLELCEQIVPEFTAYREWLAGWRSACINELALMLDDDPASDDTGGATDAGEAQTDTGPDANGAVPTNT